MDIHEINQSPPELLYRLLSRMESDCLYYLGYGGRNPRHLLAKDEREQINLMRLIYRRLSEVYDAPERMDEAKITAYAEQMCVV